MAKMEYRAAPSQTPSSAAEIWQAFCDLAKVCIDNQCEILALRQYLKNSGIEIDSEEYRSLVQMQMSSVINGLRKSSSLFARILPDEDLARETNFYEKLWKD